MVKLVWSFKPGPPQTKTPNLLPVGSGSAATRQVASSIRFPSHPRNSSHSSTAVFFLIQLVSALKAFQRDELGGTACSRDDLGIICFTKKNKSTNKRLLQKPGVCHAETLWVLGTQTAPNQVNHQGLFHEQNRKLVEKMMSESLDQKKERLCKEGKQPSWTKTHLTDPPISRRVSGNGEQIVQSTQVLGNCD